MTVPITFLLFFFRPRRRRLRLVCASCCRLSLLRSSAFSVYYKTCTLFFFSLSLLLVGHRSMSRDWKWRCCGQYACVWQLSHHVVGVKKKIIQFSLVVILPLHCTCKLNPAGFFFFKRRKTHTVTFFYILLLLLKGRRPAAELIIYKALKWTKNGGAVLYRKGKE